MCSNCHSKSKNLQKKKLQKKIQLYGQSDPSSLPPLLPHSLSSKPSSNFYPCPPFPLLPSHLPSLSSSSLPSFSPIVRALRCLSRRGLHHITRGRPVYSHHLPPSRCRPWYKVRYALQKHPAHIHPQFWGEEHTTRCYSAADLRASTPRHRREDQGKGRRGDMSVSVLYSSLWWCSKQSYEVRVMHLHKL